MMLEVSQGFWAGTHLGPWEGAGMGLMVGWFPWWDMRWDGSHGPVVG